MRFLTAIVLAVLACLPPQAQAQNWFQSEEVVTGLLAVGGTGIACYKQPCPWRGIAHADKRQRLIWSRNTLPVLIAATADRNRIVAAWNSYDCLVVDGAYDGTALTIHHIMGPCT